MISNFQPEYGRNAGAVVNIVTKSGTDAIPRRLPLEYFRNDALDARNYFNNSGFAKAPFHNNQFGGFVGGPIVKDKTFFFLDYEGQREAVGVVSLGCVPDPDADFRRRRSDKPGYRRVARAAIRGLLQIFRGLHGSQVITNDSGCPNGPNSSVILAVVQRPTSFIAKIDHSFNTNNIITGRYFFGDSMQSFPLALNGQRRPIARL